MSKSKHIITVCLALTLILGTLNSVYKKSKLPSFRFFFGSGVLWLMLNFLAEFEDEVAKNIAIAIAVFTVLGEGGGVLDQFMGSGTSHSVLDTTPKQSTGTSSPGHPSTAMAPRRRGGVNAAGVANGTVPVKPVLPFPGKGFTG